MAKCDHEGPCISGKCARLDAENLAMLKLALAGDGPPPGSFVGFADVTAAEEADAREAIANADRR